MPSSAASLKEHLRRVGEVKARSAEENTRAHLALSIGERLLLTLRLGSMGIRWGSREAPHLDHEAEVWGRVADRLKGLIARG